MELFKLLGKIAVDNSDANKALKETSAAAKSTADDITDSANSGDKASSKWGTAFKKIGSGALAFGKTVATGLAVGATALGGLTTKALSLAGELEQNMGGSEAVFKEHAEKMQETAKTAFSNMGLSTSDFLATANKMGALFQGAGFDIKTSATMSSEAMQRAADVASIMGISTEDAMEAIAGAAKGNFTMMDNLGVAMNDTTLQAYALSKGIDKSTTEMTNQEKIGLAMEMFMEKTAYAAGNYAKENETLAGSLGTAKAALSNFLSGAGTVEDVVSSFSSAANVIVKNIDELFPKLMTGITGLVNQLTPMIPPLLEKLLPGLISGATSLISGLISALPSVLDVLTNSALPMVLSGIVTIFNLVISELPSLVQSICSALPSLTSLLIDGLVSMIVTLCTNFSAIIQPIIDNLPEIIISIVSAICQNLPILIDGLITLCLGICSALPQIIQSLVDSLPLVVEMLVTALLENLPALIMGFVQLVMGVVQASNQIWGSLKEVIPAVFKGIWEALKNVFAPIGEWLNTNVVQPVVNFFKDMWDKVEEVWDGICNVVKIAFKLIGSIISAAFQIITLPFRFIWENCKEYVFAAWEWIKGKVTAAINVVKKVITNVMTAIKNFLLPILNAIKNTFSTVWNAIKNAVSTAVNAVKNTVSNTFNAVKNTVSNIWNGIKDKVSDVVNSIKNTISNVFNSVKNTVANIFNSIKEKMSAPIEKARDTIKGIVDKIKGIFGGMKLSFPNIKMPHFGISPKGWKIGDLLEGSIPKLSIDWYAKAMNSPMVMTQPTVFGYNSATGQLMGGGEAGSEVVSGTNTLMNMIGNAVESKTAAHTERIIAVLTAILNALLSGNREMLHALLADKTFKIGEREFARMVREYA